MRPATLPMVGKRFQNPAFLHRMVPVAQGNNTRQFRFKLLQALDTCPHIG